MGKMKLAYRIINPNRTIYNAGTGLPSWFTLEEARKIVDYSKGQMIYESDGVNLLWQIL